ncbi:glycosyl hydrolase 115 family protein [Ferruginibacter sp.]
MKHRTTIYGQKIRVLLLTLLIFTFIKSKAQLVSTQPTKLNLADAAIYVDSLEEILVKRAAVLLQDDIAMVTGKRPEVIHSINKFSKNIIVIGTLNRSSYIQKLQNQKLLQLDSLKGKWEAYNIRTIDVSKKNELAVNLFVITGSDRRGAAYGVFELSKQIGVSPWYWWADVPVKKNANIYINTKIVITDAPKVKYRGFFINDEAPCLSNWSKEKFGGFNHLFYEKVFELLLRNKANYLWPAMWGSAFNTDDTLNPVLADEYGIVMGTSHHEPMLRAQQEWKKFGKGAWDYTKNDTVLRDFWKKGIENMQQHESIVTVGMRGDGDMPMTQGTATALLERIVADQRSILEEITKKPASSIPQLWALYKEVQDYYDKGMRVPDDVTLLLCDDNWGNIRKLPKLDDKPRKGGYGIYYHFDYVGGPRNYKWLNTNSIPRVWEQMHIAYEYNVRNIWIVNVGDIKPMEYPISFFLDYAWNPEKIAAKDLQNYAEQWAAAQFGKTYASQIADILSKYSIYNSRRKPEMVDASTYSFNYNEWPRVVDEYNELLKKAEHINELLPAAYRDAYFQLVLHPVKACANLNEMYYNVALNKKAYTNKWAVANQYADKVKQLYINDSLITLQYHQLNNGKWNFMMSQKHIGYRSWQEPRFQTMPEVKYLSEDSAIAFVDSLVKPVKAQNLTQVSYPVFYEQDKYVSINAGNFSKAINRHDIKWELLPAFSRTGTMAVTTLPVTATPVQLTGNSPCLEYEFYTYSKGHFSLNTYFSPTLNFLYLPDGFEYAISVDDEAPQVISVNKEDKPTEGGINYKWVGDNIIIKTSSHNIPSAGKHTVKYWMINSGLVLQKLTLDFGGLKPSYLGPPETIKLNNNKK